MQTLQLSSIKLLVACLVMMLSSFKSLAQSETLSKLKRIEISDLLTASIINDFITDSHQSNRFYEDKGIISVETCPADSSGKTKYTLQIFIDNRYEDMAITKYSHYRNYVILFDSCGYSPPIPNKEDYFKTLNAEIGDRVYQRPTKKGRWVTSLNKDGEIVSGIKETRHIGYGAGQKNATIYIVERNEKFKKYKTL